MGVESLFAVQTKKHLIIFAAELSRKLPWMKVHTMTTSLNLLKECSCLPSTKVMVIWNLVLHRLMLSILSIKDTVQKPNSEDTTFMQIFMRLDTLPTKYPNLSEKLAG